MSFLNEKKFFSSNISFNSIKLLVVNTILYLVFLQAFILGALTEQFNKMDLPLFTYFAGGLFALFYIMIWANMGDMLYRHIKSTYQVFRIALLSEIPFLLIMLSLWLVFGNYWLNLDNTVKIIMLVLSMYLIIYPSVLVLSRAHRQAARKLER